MHKIKITIENKGTVYIPLVEEGIEVEWTREGVPGKLTFSVVNDKKIDFQEGNRVTMRVDDTDFFLGYVFSKSRSKEQIISVTCYDQLRYLKNKDSLRFTDKTATQMIQAIAEDYQLEYGDLEDTQYKLSLREDNKTLFDMITEGLAMTVEATGEMFILYDAYGKLRLQKIQNMILDCFVSGDTAEDFTYETSIDNDTYNTIKLVYNNKDEDSSEEYVVRDENAVKDWGILQYLETVDSLEGKEVTAESLLKYYNVKKRSLSVSGVLGDLRVRAGCLVPVVLVLGDVNANSYLMVETVKHRFENGAHTMDLTLIGGYFTG